MNDERFFTRLAEKTDAVSGAADRAPARLKSRLYSALVAKQAAAGPLRSLPATKAAGHPLCVFEHVLHVVPNERIVSMNPCRVCHARVLAEHFESPPIYWPHCPYVDFQRRQTQMTEALERADHAEQILKVRQAALPRW